jgi:hypothetical protein
MTRQSPSYPRTIHRDDSLLYAVVCAVVGIAAVAVWGVVLYLWGA